MRIQLSVLLFVVHTGTLFSQGRTISSDKITQTLHAISAYIHSEAEEKWDQDRIACITLQWRPMVSECDLLTFFLSDDHVKSSYSTDIRNKDIRRANLDRSLPQMVFRDSAHINTGLVPVYYFSPVLHNPVTGKFALQVIIVSIGEFYSTVAILTEEGNKLVVERLVDSYIRYD